MKIQIKTAQEFQNKWVKNWNKKKYPKFQKINMKAIKKLRENLHKVVEQFS